MTYKIYLDAEQNPSDGDDWVVLRSNRDFVAYIKKHGTPDFISFGDSKDYRVLWVSDCVNYLKANRIVPKGYAFHGKGPVDRAHVHLNIRYLIEDEQIRERNERIKRFKELNKRFGGE